MKPKTAVSAVKHGVDFEAAAVVFDDLKTR